MRKTLLLCTSILALSLGGAGAFAQSERGGGGGPGPAAASPGGDAGPSSSGPSSRGGADSGPAAASPDKSSPGGKMEPSGRDMGKGAAAKDDMKRGDGPSKSEASDRQDKSKPESDRAESKSDRTKDDARSDDRDRGDKATTGRSEGTSGTASGPKLSGEQRLKVQDSFRSHKQHSVKDINFSIGIGVAIPRSVTLYVVPEDIVVIVPEYRRYKYFVHEDEVVIVDPDTYEIVEVILLT